MKEIFECFWKAKGESQNKEYEVDIWLYDTQEEMLKDYKNNNKGNNVLGIFVPASMNTKYIGSMRLNKETLTKEVIIHESYHAGVELQYHCHRHLSRKYEEHIATCSAHLAEKLLDDLKEYIKE